MLRFRSTRSCSCSLTRGEGARGASRARAVTSRSPAPHRWAPEASFQEVPGGRGPWTGEVRVGVGTTEPTASFHVLRGQGPERTRRPGSPGPGPAAPPGPRLLRQVGWATRPSSPHPGSLPLLAPHRDTSHSLGVILCGARGGRGTT